MDKTASHKICGVQLNERLIKGRKKLEEPRHKITCDM